MREHRALFRVSCVCLLAVITASWTGGCTRYYVHDKTILSDMNYAKPDPGRFKYIKRNVTASASWDEKTSKESAGSKAFMVRMTSLAAQATKELLYKVNLQHNQALYNVRISSPVIVDTYFWWFLFLAGLYKEGHATVTITADVIEFI